MTRPRFFPDRATSLAFVSGLALALAFPRPEFSILAWIALVPLFAVMERRPFRSGFVAGAAFFGLVLYWLNIVMTTYGKMHPLFSVVAYLLLVCYLALFFGAATWASCRLREVSGLPAWLTLPVFWVALEFLRSFFLSGFPWATLGYSQQSHLLLIQSVDLFGVYGLSFLLVLVNGVLAEGLREGRAATGGRVVPWRGGLLALILVLANAGYGYWRLEHDLDSRDLNLRVALIQGNIDQDIKWDPSFQRDTVRIYSDLSRAAAMTGGDLLVWPESATPFYFQDGGRLAADVREVPEATGAYLLFGSPAYTRVNRQLRYLNSAFLLSPQGELLGRSDKVHLVPFGEYVPFASFLPFIEKLVVGIGDFSPGEVTTLPMNGARLGVLVCFEGIFPELARDFIHQGSDLLVNITNDAWFGRSSAPYQHLAMSRFRAVENRVWLVRAANTGISALIAPSGRIISATPIFESHYLTGVVGLGARPSLYSRHGDVIPVLFCLVSVIWLVQTRRRRLR